MTREDNTTQRASRQDKTRQGNTTQHNTRFFLSCCHVVPCLRQEGSFAYLVLREKGSFALSCFVLGYLVLCCLVLCCVQINTIFCLCCVVWSCDILSCVVLFGVQNTIGSLACRFCCVAFSLALLTQMIESLVLKPRCLVSIVIPENNES